jgi:hypothetical protein
MDALPSQRGCAVTLTFHLGCWGASAPPTPRTAGFAPLTTERLTPRPLLDGDAEALHRLVNDSPPSPSYPREFAAGSHRARAEAGTAHHLAITGQDGAEELHPLQQHQCFRPGSSFRQRPPPMHAGFPGFDPRPRRPSRASIGSAWDGELNQQLLNAAQCPGFADALPSRSYSSKEVPVSGPIPR